MRRMRPGRFALPLLVLVALVLAPLAGGGTSGGKAPLEPARQRAGRRLRATRVGKVAVRSAPTRTARVVATLEQFRPDFHPRTVLALETRLGAAGKPSWYRITVPGRPNGRTGWIRPRRPTSSRSTAGS